jgi:uncharacterized protein YfaS (alpha-2-macroglobulin family)
MFFSRNNFFQRVYILIVLMLSFSCTQKESSQQIQSDFHIEYSSSNGHSVNRPFEVQFTFDLVEDSLSKIDLSKHVQIKPKIEGDWYFEDSRKIVFQPKAPFEFDKKYQVSIQLKGLHPKFNSIQKNYKTSFKTQPLSFQVKYNESQSYNKNVQYVLGNIEFSDAVKNQKVREVLQASLGGKTLPIVWENNKEALRKIHSFKLDSIRRLDKEQLIKLSWDSEVFDADISGEMDIKILAKDVYQITSARIDRDKKDNTIIVNFSEKLDKKQNLIGLVSLGKQKFTTKIDGNNLYIYPKNVVKSNLALNISKKVKNIDGETLEFGYNQIIVFRPEEPQIRIRNTGNILTSINQSKVYFDAISLKKVDLRIIKIPNQNMLQYFQDNSLAGSTRIKYVGRPVLKKTIDISTNNFNWTTHAIDLTKLTELDENALYRLEFFIRPEYNQICEVEGKGYESDFDKEDYNNPTEHSNWNWYNDFYYDNYKWQERDNPCDISYYLRRRGALVTKNIYKSDIGITAKRGNDNLHIIALNIADNSAIKGAGVRIFNFQGEELLSSKTNESGIARFDELKEKVAFVEVVSGADKNYLRLFDGNALSLSRFDVGGMADKSNLKGFLYLNRGVRRPGDKIEVNFILQENSKTLPEGTPINFEFYDPKGKLVSKKNHSKNEYNHYHQTFSTDIEDVTGNWKVKVLIGNTVFSKTIKVETVKPNRLKILLDLPEKLNSTDGSKEINGQVNWLHGATANDLEVHSELKFTKQPIKIKGFNAYHFENDYRKFESTENRIFQGKSNGEGKFRFQLNLGSYYNFPGMMKAHISSRAYEKGGDFSMSVNSFDYSPYKNYVGILIPKGDNSKRNMLLTDKKHNLEFALVSEDGKPQKNKTVEVKIYKVHWKWWWEKKKDNFVSYATGNALHPKFVQRITTNSRGIATMPFEIKYPEWGRYLVVAKDVSERRGHVSAKTLNIDWPGWAGKSKKLDPTFASILNFTTDKEKYQTGETAQISVPSSEGGKIVVSIEKANRVLDVKTFPSQKGKTQIDLPILAEYSPNIYFNISLIYAQKNKKTDSPIRLFGTKPISVYNPQTELKPVLSMKDEVKPEEEFTLDISERNGKAMSYTIAVVDDGILDLTNFKTPKPWTYFYSKEALGVKSWDVYDDIIGAYSGKLNQVFAVGGDGSAKQINVKKAKRFKPVNLHFGPFYLPAGKMVSHKINMPRYIGSVRVMVVASDSKTKAYGQSEKSVKVKKPLMLLSSAPRKLVKGDVFKLPVTVFALKSSVKNVEVSLKSNDFIEILGDKTQSIIFNKEGEKIVEFECKVKGKTGNAQLEIFAQSGKNKVKEVLDIYTDNPNKSVVKTKTWTVKPKEKMTLPIEYFGEEGSNQLALEFSSILPMNLGKRLDYLIKYPYGCLEQTTSNSFPQLYLSSLKELKETDKMNIQKHMEKAIDKIARMQKPDGSLGYWSASSYYSSWANVYAGHFMIEAEKNGYQLPYNFKKNYLDFLYNKVSNSVTNKLTKAYSLYVLAVANQPNIAEMNKMRESNEKGLALAWLALAYKKIGQKEIAKSILSKIEIKNWNKNNRNTYGSDLRNKAILLLANKKLNKHSEALNLAKEISNSMVSKKWYSTQTTAFGLMALAEFVEGKDKEVKFTYSLDQKEKKEIKISNKIYVLEKLKAQTVDINNTSDQTLYIQEKVEGVPVLGSEVAVENKLSISTSALSEDNKLIDLSSLSQGSTFIYKIEVKNTDVNPVDNIALTQLFPSGWEILPSDNFQTNFNGRADFVDIRDDRANIFMDLKAKESKVFKIRINASYKGIYYFSGTHAQAMYDNSYSAKKKGFYVKVEGFNNEE